jgi:hypothetical protein
MGSGVAMGVPLAGDCDLNKCSNHTGIGPRGQGGFHRVTHCRHTLPESRQPSQIFTVPLMLPGFTEGTLRVPKAIHG